MVAPHVPLAGNLPARPDILRFAPLRTIYPHGSMNSAPLLDLILYHLLPCLSSLPIDSRAEHLPGRSHLITSASLPTISPHDSTSSRSLLDVIL